jgi:hypothetical protein
MQLNLIWCLKSQYEIGFSFDWITEILGKFELINHIDMENKFDKFYDNSLIIVSVNSSHNSRLIDYIEKYNRLGLNYTILHLSDEAFEQNIDFYSYSRKIIRNYFNKNYSKNYNILTIPLGYKSGIKKINLSKDSKDIDINFIGQLKSDRNTMIFEFQKCSSKYFFFTNNWEDPKGLDVNKYSEVLSKSWFTLCPRGWVNLDSFRINESLECGSIPISILDCDGQDYFRNIYHDHPFIIGKNWNDAFNIYENTNKINHQKICEDWWSQFKSKLKVRINNYILN